MKNSGFLLLTTGRRFDILSVMLKINGRYLKYVYYDG